MSKSIPDSELIVELQYESDTIKVDYDPNEDRIDYINRMKEEGFEVITPLEDEIFIDIDNEEQKKNFLVQFERLHKVMPQLSYTGHPSRSGYPREHIIIQFPVNLTTTQRIAWQSVLGSDPIKEMLSMIREYRGDKDPTLFVEKKGWENNPHVYMDASDCTCNPEDQWGQRCWVCTNIVDGGLGVCKICGGAEGSLTTHCCGRQITEDESDLIYKEAKLDFRNGEWVNASNYDKGEAMSTKEEIIKLLKGTREGMDEMLNYMEHHTDFFTAPASTKYHGNYEGGLADHSLNVYDSLTLINKEFRETPYIEDSIAVVALLHDLCKTNYYIKDEEPATSAQMFKLKKEFPDDIPPEDQQTKAHISKLIDWLINRKGERPTFSAAWRVDEKLPLGHGEKSLYLAQKFIKLTDAEALAIRWHLGFADPGAVFFYPTGAALSSACNMHQLVPMLTAADYLASWMVDQKI